MSTHNTTTESYNGWSSYATWNANLWLDQEYWVDQAKESESIYTLAEQMKTDHQDLMDETVGTECGMFTDLLQSAFDAIDWREIAEHIYESANEEE